MDVNSKSFYSNSDISSKVVNEQQKFKLKNVACWAKENKKEAVPRLAGIIAADVVAFSSFGALGNVSKLEKIIKSILPISHTKQKLLYSGVGILATTVGALMFNDIKNKSNEHVAKKEVSENISLEE